MPKPIIKLLAASFLVASMAVPPTWAQVEPAARVVGKVERVDGANLVVKTVQSETQVHVAPDAAVFAMVKAALADIKPGVFIGVGATPQPDGSQHAIRLVIFPESMRGLGEGHRPWDRPGTTMTNATVDTSVTSVDGQVLNVKYTGGEKKIVVRPDTVILTYVATDRSELKPGATVAINGIAKPGGDVEARRIVVNRDGAS
jgi:hypothetical protein